MILYSHPTGNANVRQSLLALYETDLLAEFWTCLNWNPESVLATWLPGKLQQQFARRSFDERIRARTHAQPWREVARLLFPALPFPALTRHETGALSVDAVFRALDRAVANRLPKINALKGVYTGEDAAYHTFQAAKERSLFCFYDLPIGYWRAGQAIFAEEREREPEWAATLTGTKDSQEKLARKDAELFNADVVFVASQFTKNTLLLAPEFQGEVCVAPYGAPDAQGAIAPPRDSGAKLRVLYVGSLTQRKGLSYLFEAAARLGDHIELTVIGRKTTEFCAPLERALSDCRWIPSLAHQETLEQMRRHDVLVFPSLFEGFGLVILEAMAQGIPVIATPNTAGPDLITDGEDGFLIPIRSSEALMDKLAFLSRETRYLTEMKVAALQKAQKYTWEAYRDKICIAVTGEISSL